MIAWPLAALFMLILIFIISILLLPVLAVGYCFVTGWWEFRKHAALPEDFWKKAVKVYIGAAVLIPFLLQLWACGYYRHVGDYDSPSGRYHLRGEYRPEFPAAGHCEIPAYARLSITDTATGQTDVYPSFSIEMDERWEVTWLAEDTFSVDFGEHVIKTFRFSDGQLVEEVKEGKQWQKVPEKTKNPAQLL